MTSSPSERRGAGDRHCPARLPPGAAAALRTLGAVACLAILATLRVPAAAHELGVVQVHATFRHDGTYSVEMSVDEEHVPAFEARSAPAVTTPPIPPLPAESEALLGPFLHAYLDAARFSFDGVAVRPDTAELLPHTVSPGGTPQTTLRLSGRVPAGATSFAWSAGLDLGAYPFSAENEGDESPLYQWLTAGQTSEPFALATTAVPPRLGETVRRYLVLGFTHILPKGTDHILFVLGIFLLSLRLKPMLAQVTAFTIAHTLTLGLTLYGLVSLSPRIVEPAIALSIVYVAVENVLTRELHPWRVVLVFGFGLLHGMGFAGVLSELGLPRSQFLPALVSFNVGVELGQLTVILVAFALIGLPFRRRPWYRQRVVVPLSLAIAAMGLFWAVQRIFF